MNRRSVLRLLGAAAVVAPAWQRLSRAQAPLTVQSLTDRLSVLMGAGGNITVLRSDEGLLLVDSGLPETAAAVQGKVKEISALPVQHLINTHWHGDHVGGNVAFGTAGAHIMAQENCAKRVATAQHMAFLNRDTQPLALEGRPKQTFSKKGQLTFGKQQIAYLYYPPAHTDGDITVQFSEANVYSTGDLFFCGMYPFIDYSSGGSIEGMIANSAAMLKVVDAQTKIVPGHGALATKMDLQKSHDMLADANQHVSKLVAEGKTLPEIAAAAPTKMYDTEWGKGFLKPADWLRMLYEGKTKSQAKAA